MDIDVKDENTCRTCLKSAKNGRCLFEVCLGSNSDDKTNIKYSEMLSSCSGINTWEGDGLPSMLCQECSQFLPQMWTFLTMCKTSDSLLHASYKFVENMELKVEVKEEYPRDIEEVEEEDRHSCGEAEIEGHILFEEQKEKVRKKVRGKYKKKDKKMRVAEWKCNECSATAETECRLKKHYKKEHPNVPYIYTCADCNKVFKRKTDLRVHTRIHSGERPYECEMCGAGFTQWGTWKQHTYAHTGEKPYSCSKCNARFSSTASLRRHEQTHTGEKRHICELCGAKFICAAALRAHHVTHSSQRPHKCSLCSRTFKSRLALRNHESTHGERTFVCEDCGKDFYVKGNLSKHRKKMHREGAGTCPICHKATSDLREHSTIHSQELNYHCEICRRGFRHKGVLNAHMAQHKNANKHKCPAEGCNVAFYRKNLLDFHYNKVHANNTPHHCSHCTQGFYRLSDLTRHVNTFHLNHSAPQDK